MEKFTWNSNISIFHDFWSDFKVSEMGWEVKNIVRGQSKHGLWGSNLKTGKFLPGALRSKFAAPFSEHCCPFGPLVGDLIKHHLKVTVSVYRFRTYKIFVSTLSISGDINFSIFVIIFWILENYSNFW